MDVQYWSNPSNRYKSIYLISYAFSGLLPTHMGPTPILALILICIDIQIGSVMG